MHQPDLLTILQYQNSQISTSIQGGKSSINKLQLLTITYKRSVHCIAPLDQRKDAPILWAQVSEHDCNVFHPGSLLQQSAKAVC